jgi:hypothetical protein
VSAESQDSAVVIVQAASVSPFYTKTEMDRELRQGEVICNLTQYLYNPEQNSVETIPHPYAVVVNQDCDLLQDYNARNGGKGTEINSVLLYIAEPTESKRAQIDGDIWRRVLSNSNDRYHLLSKSPASCDLSDAELPSLIIDFKGFFTLPPDEVYRQCAAGEATRRTRLEMPYREHLQCRAAFYFQRVMLPEQHSAK